MKKIIIPLLLLLFFCVKSFGQSTITQTYIDPCDNKVYVVTIPFGQNQTIAIIRGQSRIVTLADMNSGAFQLWVNKVFSTPCSTQDDAILLAQQAAAKAAADAAARAAADAAAKAAADAAAKAAAAAASNAAGNAASSAASNAASSAASNAASGAASNAASSAASSSASSAASNSASSAAAATAAPPPPPPPASAPPPPPASGGGSSSPPANGGSSSGGESSSSSSNGGSSSSSSSSGESKSGNSSSSSESKSESKTESKSESKTEEKKTESKSEEKKEESKSEEKKSDDKKEEKKSEEKKEEKKEEEKKKEEKKKEEDKKKKAEVTNPLLLASDLTTAQQADGSYLASISLGVSKSSLMGDESYSGGLVVNSNLSAIVTTAGYTKMAMTKDGQLAGIHSYGTAFAYLAGNYMNLLGYTFIKPTPKRGTYGYNLGVINLFLKNNDGGFDYNVATSAIVFWTKPYVYSKKLTISPQVFTMFSPIAWNSVTNVTTVNRHMGFLLGSSFDYKLSKRFGFSFNYKLSGSTNPNTPFLSNFLIGSRMML